MSDQQSYDIDTALRYTGASTEEADPIPEGMALIGYRDSDENARRIALLLSFEQIPFNLERYRSRPTQSPRMTVVVPLKQYQDALAILRAAAAAHAIEIIEGDEGAATY